MFSYGSLIVDCYPVGVSNMHGLLSLCSLEEKYILGVDQPCREAIYVGLPRLLIVSVPGLRMSFDYFTLF